MNEYIPQNNFQLTIAEKVITARKKANMTQEELANAIGSTQSAVARMEAGNQNFTSQMLDRLSDVLGPDIFTTKPIEKSVRIIGNTPLEGVVEIQGAKNSALPAIAAALLASNGTTIIRNVPNVHDVHIMLEVAKTLGAKVVYDEKEHTVSIDAENLTNYKIPHDLSSKVRTCTLFLAPLVLRLGRAQLPSVGGCSIGERKTDFHYRGFSRFGAEVKSTERFLIDVKAEKLTGNYIYLDTPSHTGTENLLMVACLAQGDTVIDNAASDPEVVDLANMLVDMGAQIKGIGSRTLYISSVAKLNAVEHTLIPDRHDFTAFAVAAAITKGKITLKNVIQDNQRITDAKLRQMGVEIEYEGTNATVQAPNKLKPINIITYPYPGFPTDAQPSITVLATMAEGKSYIRETIFESRYGYVDYLNEMGADIIVSKNNVIMVEGVTWLDGGNVRADDIRAGFGLVTAGLAARGETIVENIYQIERGHEKFVERLRALGADISNS